MKSTASPIFGKRKDPHTIIIAHGEFDKPFHHPAVGCRNRRVRLRGDGHRLSCRHILSGVPRRPDRCAAARQARLQEAYEDRISALRAQVDRIASRDFLDQQLMEQKVADLIKRQQTLSQRRSRLAPLVDRAAASFRQPMPPVPDTPVPTRARTSTPRSSP